MAAFKWRPAHKIWKSVIYIQTNVKSKLGCGTPIVIKFYAPLDVSNLEDEIVYDYEKFGNDLDLIMNAEDEKYCMKQCFKMCYYVQKMYNQEILKMKAEFTKDDNGTVRILNILIIYRYGSYMPLR